MPRAQPSRPHPGVSGEDLPPGDSVAERALLSLAGTLAWQAAGRVRRAALARGLAVPSRSAARPAPPGEPVSADGSTGPPGASRRGATAPQASGVPDAEGQPRVPATGSAAAGAAPWDREAAAGSRPAPTNRVAVPDGAEPAPGPGAVRESPWIRYGVPLAVVAVALWAYVATGWPGLLRPDFDHSAWEAWALLHGHVATPPPPPGDSSNMILFHGRWTSYFPPMGAFLYMPLELLFGGPLRTPDRLFCALIASACPLLVYAITRRAGLRLAARLWLTALLAFGTVFWYAAVWGTPWYYVQVVTVFFYLLALCESFGPNRPWLTGTWFGCALLSRNPVALGIPFLFWRERRLEPRRIAGFLAPVAAAVAVQLWWNWVRTGNPLHTGYGLILVAPFLQPSFAQGMFSPVHLPWQLYSIFFLAPAFQAHWPYLQLSSTGQSLTLTTPAFIYTLEAPIRRRGVWLGLLSVVLTALPQLFYYANGAGQFGNRFSLDYTPLLLALLIFGIGERFRWQHAALIVVSIFLCGYGAVYMGQIQLLPHWGTPAVARAVGDGRAAGAAGARNGSATPASPSCAAFPWLARCPTVGGGTSG